MTYDLRPFCFDHPGACLLPADHLHDGGVSAEARAALLEREGLTAAHIDLFERGYRLYKERSAELFARAPGSWLPPRKAHVLFVTDPDRVAPYSAPFLGVSWFFYLSDLDPSTSNEEWVAFQIFFVERLGFIQVYKAAVGYNLAYFLTRSEGEIRRFCEAASRSSRPDRDAFVKLAEAMPDLLTLHHTELRPPPSPPPERMHFVEGADLLIPPKALAGVQGVIAAFDAASRSMGARFVARQAELSAELSRARGCSPAGALIDYLRKDKPRALLLGTGKQVVYDPDQPISAERVEMALASMTALAADSLIADLQVVSEKSRAVLASLRAPDRLPLSCGDVELAGGAYIRADVRLVVLDVAQPGFDALRLEAPPLHRKLLAARTVHEWGHLVFEAGWIAVPPAKRGEYATALAALSKVYTDVVRAMPERLASDARKELAELGADPASPGTTLARVSLKRISDYGSNLFFRRYLTAEEALAYVQNNVRHHLNEGLGPLSQLVRYAIELQYQSLLGHEDPVRYLLSTSYVGQYLIESGVFSMEVFRSVVDATARVCRYYELDQTAFN